MARPLVAGLAPGIILSDGYIVKLVALDPTTGAAVTGVVVSGVSMQVDTIATEDDTTQLPELLPVYVAGPTE